MASDRASEIENLNMLIADMIDYRMTLAEKLAEAEKKLATLEAQRWTMVLTK